MKTPAGLLFVAIIATSFSSCGVLKESSEFSDGYYNYRGQKVYVTHNGDSSTVYGARMNHPVDTVAIIKIPATAKKDQLPKYIFTRSSFDLDIVTMPVKYRPSLRGFPNQLNTQVNGGVFIGARKDYFNVQEVHAPMTRNKVETNHFGFSYGIFAGIGATAMNSYVTENAINIEYDGVIFTKGVSAIIALNKFNVGLAIGTDHLLDRNRKSWIYEEKPWLGISVGLNLN